MALPRGNSDRSQRKIRESFSDERESVRERRIQNQKKVKSDSQRRKTTKRNSRNSATDNRKRSEQSSSRDDNVRSLNKASKEAIKASKKNTGPDKGTLTLDQMRKYVGEQDDFYYDLDKSASLFINKELRTPPDREEMKKLKAERIRRAKEQKEALEEILAQQAREDEEESRKQFNYDE